MGLAASRVAYQPLVEKHEVVIGDKIWVLSPKDQVRKCTVVDLKSDAVQVEYPNIDWPLPDPEWIEKTDTRILSQADVLSKDEELVRTVDEILGKIQFLMQGKVKQSDPTFSCTCCLSISNLFVKKEDVDLVKEVEELYGQCSAKRRELERTQARAREEGRGEIVDRIAEQLQTIRNLDLDGGKIGGWKKGEDLKQACPRGAQESNYTKHLSLSWCLSNLSCFEKVTRIVKSLVMVACLASLDVIGDVATTKLYKDQHLWFFFAFSVALLLATPALTYLFMLSAGVEKQFHMRIFCKYVLTWKIWEEAVETVKAAEAQFGLMFVALMEACIEAFPVSILQQFSFIADMLSSTDISIFGFNIEGEIIVQASMLLSLVTISKTLFTFDFYGSEAASYTMLVLRAIRRFGEVASRTTSIALFWFLFLPEATKTRGFHAYHMPVFFLTSWSASIIIVRNLTKIKDSQEHKLPLTQQFIWGSLLMLGSLPAFLGAFDAVNNAWMLLRAGELAIMGLLLHAFAEDPIKRATDQPLLVYVLCAGLACLIVATVFEKVYASIVLTRTGYNKVAETKDANLEAGTNNPEQSPEEVGVKSTRDPLRSAAAAGDVAMVSLLAQLMDLNELDVAGRKAFAYSTTTAVFIAMLKFGTTFGSKVVCDFMNNRDFTDDALEALAGSLAQPKSLKYVDLNFAANTNFTDDGLKALAQSLQQYLEHFVFNVRLNENFTDIGLKALAKGLAQPKSLKYVDLNFAQNRNFTDDGLKALARSLQNHANLEYFLLNVHMNKNFTDTGMKDLNKALRHKDLKKIKLVFSSSKFADSTLQALADTLKQCSSLTEDNTYLRLPNSDTGKHDDMDKRIFGRD